MPKETAIGYVPNAEDINLGGSWTSASKHSKSILEVDNDAVEEGSRRTSTEFYKKFGDKLPAELKNQLNILKSNLA